jgi:hypothetical protein
LYPRRENFKTLRCSNLHRLKVGFADNRAHPDRTSSASQGARLLHLLPQAFLYVLFVQYVKVRFVVNRRGIGPRPLWGLALYSDLPFSCPFPRL